MRILFNVPTIQLKEMLPYTEYPLGLLSITEYVNKRLPEVKFNIIVGELDIQDVRDFRPDLIGISTVTVLFSEALTTVKNIRAMESSIPIIMGGIHISQLPHNLPNEADIAVIGEGEKTFLELCELYMHKKRFVPEDISGIKGIAFRENETLHLTERREPLDVESIPVIKNYDICEFKSPKELHYHIITSRGCPYKCRFCASTSFWGNIRFLSPEKTVEQIQFIVDTFSPPHVHIFDDLFTVNKRRLRIIQQLIIKKGLHRKTAFECWVSGNSFNEEVAGLLREMNVSYLNFALESGSPAVYRYLKGNWNSPEKNAEAIRLAHRQGFIINTSLILGSPIETTEDMQMTYDFVKSLIMDGCVVHLLTPYPGTEIWEYAKQRKLVSDDMQEWHELELRDLSDQRTIYLGEKATREETQYYYLKIIKLLNRKSRARKYIRKLRYILAPKALLRLLIWKIRSC